MLLEDFYPLFIIISAYLLSTEKVVDFVGNIFQRINKKYDSVFVEYMISPFALASAGLFFFLRYFVVPVGSVVYIGEIIRVFF